jgi:hypothetical protein
MRKLKLEKRASIGAVTGPAALLVALVAVVISLTSGAAAAPHGPKHGHKITAGDLAAGAVTSRAIAAGAVTASKIKKSAVIAAKLAKGSVSAEALAKGSVTAEDLAKGSVTSPAIAEDSVTKSAIAPGSIYGGALAPETIHVTPITDKDAVPSNPEWTTSDTQAALCGQGEALLGGGFIFTNPGNREVSFTRSQPFLSGSTPSGMAGEISSNSGGTSQAQIIALCLGG